MGKCIFFPVPGIYNLISRTLVWKLLINCKKGRWIFLKKATCKNMWNVTRERCQFSTTWQRSQNYWLVVWFRPLEREGTEPEPSPWSLNILLLLCRAAFQSPEGNLPALLYNILAGMGTKIAWKSFRQKHRERATPNVSFSFSGSIVSTYRYLESNMSHSVNTSGRFLIQQIFVVKTSLHFLVFNTPGPSFRHVSFLHKSPFTPDNC